MNSENINGLDINFLRSQTLGNCYKFKTPFGDRLLTYADYIASGRNVKFVERYLLRIQEAYANTHTEDDITGKSTTELLHQAELRIKQFVNGNEQTRIIATGTGATGAINKLQQILGLYIPPATEEMIKRYLQEPKGSKTDATSRKYFDRFTVEVIESYKRIRPIVFVGPYEHHSNEVTWRECLAEVVVIGLTDDGEIDLEELEKKVCDPQHNDRMKIGSFSAASNVTGMKSQVYEIARIMHKYGGIVCFDYAASAPYVEINMNKDTENYFDALFISPHKFLGGPGSSGLLIFNEKIYRRDLPPTCGGGGTVDYVSPFNHDFISNIEEREKAGTPGTLQIIKAALALEIKTAVGTEKIEKIENEYITRAIKQFSAHPNIDVLGNPDPSKRISIVSFNIKDGDKVLHPKFVTRLINDLFGIQSRAGCSCAGPYGHALLGIGKETSEQYRQQVKIGFNGLKPGWVRIGFHFTLSSIDFDFICEAVEFIADKGHLFLPLYSLDLKSGTWSHLMVEDHCPQFSLTQAISSSAQYEEEGTECDRTAEYAEYLKVANKIARDLEDPSNDYCQLQGDQEKLRFFNVVTIE